MSTSRNEFHAEAREVSRLLTQLASRAESLESEEFLRAWSEVVPRVLYCLQQTEDDEGATSGRLERLRNLSAEVGATAKAGQLRTAALCRLAQGFGTDIAIQNDGGARQAVAATNSRWLDRLAHELRDAGAPIPGPAEASSRGSVNC